MAPLLQIKDLHVTLAGRRGTLRALRGSTAGHGEHWGSWARAAAARA
jgi:hypothetical protein